MTQRNVRGAYVNFTHDRAADWDWLRKWQPNVIRYMGQGSINDPNSFDVNRVKRIHETCPGATILLRCWEVDDNNFQAHEAMVADPRGTAQRQVDWWAKVFDRAGAAGVPRALLMAGLNNETGPEKDASLYPYTEFALEFATPRAVRLGVLVFSVGRPSLPGEAQYTIETFSRLDNAVLANGGAIVLHQYMQPEGMYAVWTDDQGNERKDFTYLIGRDKRWNVKSPIIQGEWGIDGILYNRHPDPVHGNSGWRNFKAEWPPQRYADEYVECVRQAHENTIGICPFISDWADHKWQSFDLIDAYEEFLARKDLCVKDAPDTPPSTVHIPSVGTGKPTTPAYIIAPAGANLRSAPITGQVIIAIPYAEEIRILGVMDTSGWLKVRYRDQEGYMAASLVGLVAPEPLPTPTTGEGPTPVEKPQGDKWQRSLAFVRKWEGGWADDPNDPGGATNKGITLGTYTRWREQHGQPPPTKDDLRNISDAETNQIYYEWYWTKSGANNMAWPLCLAHFDTAVNAGVGRAQETLHQSGNLFIAYMGHLIDWYTRIPNFEHFGKAWIRRRADILLEASK